VSGGIYKKVWRKKRRSREGIAKGGGVINWEGKKEGPEGAKCSVAKE